MFVPNRVLFDPEALNYALGEKLYKEFLSKDNVEVRKLNSSRATGIPGDTTEKGYMEAKRTMLVTVRKNLKFQTCKPSAHYQLPLVSSCPGLCEYCYLQTTLGNKPVIKVYVNINEILDKAHEYITKREDTTIFEGAATSDPLPVEEYTNALYKTIEFFGNQPKGKFRFVTKFSNVDSLLGVKHNGRTTFRFSLNTERVIKEFEKGTSSANARIEAANKVSNSGFPMGFLIAPIFHYPNWEEEYLSLLMKLKESLMPVPSLTFELIAHRFTTRAKNNIMEVFPNSKLPMDEDHRQLKYGQFGYTKYVYPKDVYKEIEPFFREHIKRLFPEAEIQYLV